MSYCRWSCMDFACDVYCYQAGTHEFVTHVAHKRVLGEVPPTPSLAALVDLEPGSPKFEATIQEHVAARRQQSDFLEKAAYEPIGLPHDGETFYDTTEDEMFLRLADLARIGYRVPPHLLEYAREVKDKGTAT